MPPHRRKLRIKSECPLKILSGLGRIAGPHSHTDCLWLDASGDRDFAKILLTRRVERGGAALDLTTREFDLLVYLLRHKNELVSREMLAKDVWKETSRATPLDNVIDVNFYPTIEARNSNLRHRPVGLGIMGFQDALYALNINFASEACVKFADESMEAVSYYAILASTELAKERDVYASYEGSKWSRGILPVDTIDLLEQERGERIETSRSSTLDWSVVRAAIKKHGMRNSNCLAIAPTATISNISGCTPSIEPIYKNLYVKANQFGDFIVINGALVDDLKKLDLWDESMLKKLKYFDGNIAAIEEIPTNLREKYKETFDIEPQWLIRAAAARGSERQGPHPLW